MCKRAPIDYYILIPALEAPRSAPRSITPAGLYMPTQKLGVRMSSAQTPMHPCAVYAVGFHRVPSLRSRRGGVYRIQTHAL